MRIAISEDPFGQQYSKKTWREANRWPAWWIGCPDVRAPFVCAFRLRFEAGEEDGSQARLHVSADERYELFLDGQRLGRGPERGAPDVWYFESYQVDLTPGRHILAARVWALGDIGMEGQMSAQTGFLLAAEGEWNQKLSTGIAGWECMQLKGYSFHPTGTQRGCRFSLNGRRHQWGHEAGGGRGWKKPVALQQGMGRWTDWFFFHNHRLHPAPLPELLEQYCDAPAVRHIDVAEGSAEVRSRVQVTSAGSLKEEIPQWTALFEEGKQVVIPAHAVRRVILELPDYTTAYPELEVSGGEGAELQLYWAEALHTTPDFFNPSKGNRGEIEGKYFTGIGDHWLLDGGERSLSPLFWIAGRFVEVYAAVRDQPLEIRALRFRERRYPLEPAARFSCSDERLNQIQPILVRGMQMCSNETFMDCPYYEEMMYAGDTRLEILVTRILTDDVRLTRKAIQLFDSSRMATGFTQARYPCKSPQVIAPFAIWWVGMVHDYLFWQEDVEFAQSLIPGVRQTMQAYERWCDQDGILHGPEGWNIIDWVPAWDKDAGVPPEGHEGISGVLNWQLVYGLSLYADLEKRIGDPELADWAVRRAARLAVAAENLFWDEQRGLLADTTDHRHFSEHTQLMALLSGFLDPQKTQRAAEGLFSAPDLQRATIFFSHYYFEVCRKFGRMDKFMERMQLWFYLKEMGFKTPVEMPEPSRSDCHAWSSHPLFHYQATILGVRPAEPGFRSVEIAPQPGHLTWAEGSFPMADGEEISSSFRREGAGWRLKGKLPPGLSGTLIWGAKSWPLYGGDYDHFVIE